MDTETRNGASDKTAQRAVAESPSAAPALSLDDIRQRVCTDRKPLVANLLDYFRTHEHYPAFARVLNCEGQNLGEFAPSLAPSVGERGAFAISKTSDGLYYRVCRFGKRGEKTYRMFYLPHLYAIVHGVDPDAALSNVALIMWTRLLLHDSGVRVVQRTKFRAPYDGVKKLFLSAAQERDLSKGVQITTPASWVPAVAFLEGLGKRVDIEDDSTRFVPFAAEFALTWCEWGSERPQVSDRRAAQIVLAVRQRLIKAGLVIYKEVAPRKSMYRPAPPDEGETGMDARELRTLWDA